MQYMILQLKRNYPLLGHILSVVLIIRSSDGISGAMRKIQLAFASLRTVLVQPNIYSLRQLLTFGHIMDFAFPQFLPFFQKNVETNDTSFESPKTELLESGEKVGVALSWSWPRPPKQKSTSFTRICVEPFMTQICPISKLLSNNG